MAPKIARRNKYERTGRHKFNDVWFPNQNPSCVSNFDFVFQRRIKFQDHKSY